MSINKSIADIKTDALRYEDGTTLVGQENTPGLSAYDMQMSVENLGRNVLIPKVNEMVAELNNTYSKAETDAAISEKVIELGAGDMAKGQYDPSGAVLAAGGIPAYTAAVSIEKAAAYRKPLEYVTVTLPASGWSKSAPYTQTVSVSGMTADWVPGVPALNPNGKYSDGNISIDDVICRLEYMSHITMITSSAGALTFTCADTKPGGTIYLRVPGMVERS